MSTRCLVQALLSGSIVVLASLGPPSVWAADAADRSDRSVDSEMLEAGAESGEADGAQEAESVAASDSTPPPPVGVRLGETLENNRFRLGYSWERLRSQGLLIGTNDKSPAYVRALPPERGRPNGYTSTLRSFETTIHTIELAYAPHPRVTLVAEIPFVQKEIERVDSTTPGACSGVRCQHQTEGIGDVRFAMIVPFIKKGFESSQIHIGLDVPTGAIRRQGGTPLRLPYLAQIGNGTVDFEWGWTYRGALDRFSWGGQALGRHPLARNGLNYREGSQFIGRVWGAVRLFAGVDLSLRADWEKQNEFEGFDRGLRPAVDPAEDGEKYDRTTITLSPGFSVEVPSLAGTRVGIEVGVPVYQEVDGPQLERDWSIKTAWRWIY